MDRRGRISDAVRHQVLTEAGFRCAVPTCRTILAIDLYHMVPVSEGGPDNVLALCPTCHALFHRGIIPRSAISTWKAILAALNRAFDFEAIDLLLFLKLQKENRVIVSGDGVLKFARLIAAGLATYHIDFYQAGKNASYRLDLSSTGDALVNAWIEGDPGAVTKALARGAPASS